jgi:hypothetical protein
MQNVMMVVLSGIGAARKLPDHEESQAACTQTRKMWQPRSLQLVLHPYASQFIEEFNQQLRAFHMSQDILCAEW